MKIAFVTNICAHYRVKTFETLARVFDVDYYFYSAGNEWYWQLNHGVRVGNFRHAYLSGFQLTRRIRITPSLMTKLWFGNYSVFVKCINGRFALPVTYTIARLRRKPFVLWTGIWMTLETPFHRLAFPLTRWIYRHADAIAVYGEHVKHYLVQQGVRPEKIFIAAHAMDNALYSRPVSSEKKASLRSDLDIHGRKVVLYLGRLEEVKGLDYLIIGLSYMKCKDVVLVLAGDGSLRKNLEDIAREAGVERNIRFAGYVPSMDAPNYYAIADTLVLPSITTCAGKETWGLVVNEAMNQGVPVIATDAVGAAAGGLVQSGVNGFVVPERNSAALAEAMERILNNDALRAQLSANAQRTVASWDNERMVKGFQSAIEYALRRRAHTDARNQSMP